MNMIIPNSENLEKNKANIKKEALSKLHVLADFDRTLTYGSINGLKTPSIISMLRDGKHLSEEYAKKAHELYDKYAPMESDPSLSKEEKKSAMREWWETHNKLLLESGLSITDLEDIVQNGIVEFRKGVGEFLDFLNENSIPLVIMSASGCGDAIPMFFEKYGKNYPNIYYVINRFEWDENGKAINYKQPVVHSLNKDETVLKNMPEIFEKVEERSNVILLGDSVDDIGMVEGFDYTNLIRIGFLNGDYNKDHEIYEKNFDIVLEGDGDFEEVNKLINDLES